VLTFRHVFGELPLQFMIVAQAWQQDCFGRSILARQRHVANAAATAAAAICIYFLCTPRPGAIAELLDKHSPRKRSTKYLPALQKQLLADVRVKSIHSR
jgi:hypothetical protein